MDPVHRDSLAWLLAPDSANPGVRYFTLRDLLGQGQCTPEVRRAQTAVMDTGPVPAILDAQYPAGYWIKPGPGYSPKYRGTLWQIIFLAQLGADGQDQRIRRAVEHVFARAQTRDGAFACNGRPSTAIHCLWGTLTRALLDLGYWADPRLERAIDGLARSITGVDYTQYHRSGIQGPGFACAANEGFPCAWGAIRALWALNRVPVSARTSVVEAAIHTSIDFLLRYDIAHADYPRPKRISPNWLKFGYPLAYATDVLLNLEVLIEAVCEVDPRLTRALQVVCSKQDAQGRWNMEHSYNGKMWADIEQEHHPSKWVTLRAVRVLSRAGHLQIEELRDQP